MRSMMSKEVVIGRRVYDDCGLFGCLTFKRYLSADDFLDEV